MRILLATFLFMVSLNLKCEKFYITKNIVQYHFIDTIKEKNKYKLAYTSSALLNKYLALQVKHIYEFGKYLNLEMETGLIAYSLNDNKNTHGYRIRPSIIFKVINEDNISLTLNTFYNHRYVKFDKEVSLSRANGSYTEFVKGSQEVFLNGPGFSFGIIGNKKEKYNWHFNFGIGFGLIKNKYEKPDLRENVRGFFDFGSTNKQEIPIFFFNLSHRIF